MQTIALKGALINRPDFGRKIDAAKHGKGFADPASG
jgi:hypothetical protein